MKITKNELTFWLDSHEVSIRDVIDTYIEGTGTIGVGLITLEQQLVEIVKSHHTRRLR